LFSSTPIDTIVSDLALLASPLSLAQCIGLEMGEPSSGDVSIIEGDSLNKSNELCLVEPFLEEDPFDEFYGDIMVGSIAPSIGLIDSI